MTSPSASLDATHDTLVLSEVFGPTVCGEGPSTGRTASFIRTGGCNLTCRFCDTPYTWDGARFDLRAELSRVPVADVLRQVRDHRCSVAVITGGEPLLHQQQQGWRTLLDGLVDLGRRVEVETNGTVLPDAFTRERVDAFNVSPKLAFAGMAEDVRIRPQVVKAFLDTNRAIFKFVCRVGADVDAVDWLAGELDIPPHLVWIMPEGKTTEVLAVTTANIVDQALQYRFNITTRLHVLIWGNERGR